MAGNKIAGGAITAYGLFYLLFPHEVHMKYGLDWIIGGWTTQGGFPHYIHLLLGAVLAITGFMLFTGKWKTPKSFASLYGNKR